MNKIGFFGLGLMGGNIVENLLKKKYEIISNKRGRAISLSKNFNNIKLFDHSSEVANSCEIIMSCLDTVENLEDLVYGEHGVMEAKSLPDFFFDFGTGRPSFVKKLSEDFKSRGSTYIDMPIGRTPLHALDGKLNLFISSTENKLIKHSVVLNDIAENLIYLNDLGQGTKIKLFNNYYGQAVTLIFGKLLKNGSTNNLNIEKLLNVMSLGPLHSGILDAIFPYFTEDLSGTIEFSINNAFKDLVYFKEECSSQDFLVDSVLAAFEQAISKGYGECSVGEVAKYVD